MPRYEWNDDRPSVGHSSFHGGAPAGWKAGTARKTTCNGTKAWRHANEKFTDEHIAPLRTCDHAGMVELDDFLDRLPAPLIYVTRPRA
jgi:hypothetical protein